MGPAPDLLYGRQGIREVLRAGRRRCKTLYLARGLKPSPLLEDIVVGAKDANIGVEYVERLQLDQWLQGANHQGVALDADSYRYVQQEDMLALAGRRDEHPLLLILDRVQDPQNLGTLLRTSEAVGVHGIILPKHRSATVSPAVVNSSAGAVEHLLIGQETNLVTIMRSLKASGLWLVGLEALPQAIPARTAGDSDRFRGIWFKPPGA